MNRWRIKHLFIHTEVKILIINERYLSWVGNLIPGLGPKAVGIVVLLLKTAGVELGDVGIAAWPVWRRHAVSGRVRLVEGRRVQLGNVLDRLAAAGALQLWAGVLLGQGGRVDLGDVTGRLGPDKFLGGRRRRDVLVD